MKRCAVPAALLAITALGATLRMVDLGRAGLGHLYYASAIRSMGLSLHNFVFAVQDPVGTLITDKPPLALWLQVISTKLFGFNGIAIILPMAIAGTLAIPFTFAAARRSYGVAVGLAAAGILSVFPESVATARDSTMDALLMAMLAGGTVLLLRAVEERRTGLLVAWAALMGLVFNVKFFLGFLIMPAAVLYLALRWRAEYRARLPGLACAMAVLAVVSFSWITFVDLTPRGKRPLVLHDESNSEFGLVLRYNGWDRVFAARRELPATPDFPGARKLELERIWRDFGYGNSGPLRFFRDSNGPLFGTIVVLALLGLGIVAWRGLQGGAGPGLLWGAWGATGMLLFTFSHRGPAHYAEAFAPALAALGAVGLVEAWRRSEGRQAMLLPLLVAAVATLAWFTVRDHPPLQPATHLACFVSLGAAALALGASLPAVPQRGRLYVRGVAAMTVLGIPLAISTWIALDAPRGERLTRPNPLVHATVDPVEIDLRTVPAEEVIALPAPPGARYAFGIDTLNGAAEAIAYTGAAVLPIWSEYRETPVIALERLEELLTDGEVPYLLLSRQRYLRPLFGRALRVIDRHCNRDRSAWGTREDFARILHDRSKHYLFRWSLWRCGEGEVSTSSG